MPCKDCKDRCVGCHGRCEKYISWHENHIEEQKKKGDYLRKHDYREDIEKKRSLGRMVMYGDAESKNKLGLYVGMARFKKAK